MSQTATKEKCMTAKEKTLDDLFEDALKDVFYAENKILKALPEDRRKRRNGTISKRLLKST